MFLEIIGRGWIHLPTKSIIDNPDDIALRLINVLNLKS